MIQANPKKIEIPSKTTYKLDGIVRAAERLGRPDRGRRTILVAGTNGKGSVCHYLTSLFGELGIKVGTYTSPHLISRTERIRIRGEPISEAVLRRYEGRFKTSLDPLSYFERLTLIAFLYFRDQKVDLQILEVGMGGRLDATNICDPDFSVISRIDYDHQEVLGRTLTKIAREKAGIMRGGRAVFVSSQVPEAKRSLQREALRVGALLTTVSGRSFARSLQKEIERLGAVRGRHQQANAFLALAVFSALCKKWKFKFSPKDVRSALKKSLPWARIQEIRKRPLFIVDGSHNLNSIDALIKVLKARYRSQRFEILFGAMKDKPARLMIERIRPFASSFSYPRFYSERQLDPKALQRLSPGEPVENLESWLNQRWKEREPVLVVGSLYLAGEVLKILRKQGKWKTS